MSNNTSNKSSNSSSNSSTDNMVKNMEPESTIKNTSETYIVFRENNKFTYSSTNLLHNSKDMKTASHHIKEKILNLISRNPMFASEISEILKEKDQTIYYHLRGMDRLGMIEVVEKKHIRGVVAKKYAPTKMSLAISYDKKKKLLSDLISINKDEKYPLYLKGLIEDNFFNAKFVVGSPDPHGEFKAYSRDGHYVTHLALGIGSYAKISNEFSVVLDVDLKSQKGQVENLIVVGGPVTNTFMHDINDLLKVRFSDKKPWGIENSKTGNIYTDDSVGMIAKIKNPYNPSKNILVVAGVRSIGTKAAVLALTKYWNVILKSKGKELNDSSWGIIVQGFDYDSDGEIDNIEIIE